MGKGREKGRRKGNKQKQRTREERDLVKEKLMERFESAERAKPAVERISVRNILAARVGSDPPPILGEPETLVRAPLKPKPHPRSGAIALLEPEPEDALLTVNPKSIPK
jgi:hypothetical protein